MSRDDADPQERPGEINRLRAENFVLKRSVSERDRRIADILSSTSWRITAPLRALVEGFRKRRGNAP